jgi:hypothetical protein
MGRGSDAPPHLCFWLREATLYRVEAVWAVRPVTSSISA